MQPSKLSTPVRSADMSGVKPPYSLPTMAEVGATPSNGYSVVSTFSGCGGTCLGFKQAGFRTLWASEFIPAAAEVYRLNHPGVELDTQDIREVAPEDILGAIGLGVGEVDVLEGSPPCASFSMVGRRATHWGEVTKYSDTKQRVDDLFWEYARLLKGIQPKVFVAENVAGLVRGVAKGYFKAILAELTSCGYVVECRLLDARWLGVPQARQRTIFLGVREDLEIAPAFPKPLAHFYSIRDALPWLRGGFGEVAPGLVEAEADITGYAIGREWDNLREGEVSKKYLNLVKPALNKPAPTITQLGGYTSAAGVTHPTERRKFSIAELRRICGFPADFQLTGTYTQQWERLGRAVPPPVAYAIAKTIAEEVLSDGKD